MKLVLAKDLKEGDVILLPFKQTVTILKEPKVGREYVTIRTERGVRRLAAYDDVQLRTKPGEY